MTQLQPVSTAELTELAVPLDAELRKLRPIDLNGAMSDGLLSRMDTKLALPLSQLLGVLSHLTTRRPSPYRLVVTPTGFAPCYTTVYFDTPDLRDYQAHHNRRRIRQKYRYRRYSSTGTVFFEIKQRVNPRLTRKTRVAVPDLPEAVGCDETLLASRLGLDVRGLIPTIEVVYHRVTLVGDEQRITIDVDMSCQARNGRRADFANMAILEVKDRRRQPDSPIAGALRGLGLRPHPISKYCIGIASCFDDIKYNRFRPTLRKFGVS